MWLLALGIVAEAGIVRGAKLVADARAERGFVERHGPLAVVTTMHGSDRSRAFAIVGALLLLAGVAGFAGGVGIPSIALGIAMLLVGRWTRSTWVARVGRAPFELQKGPFDPRRFVALGDVQAVQADGAKHLLVRSTDSVVRVPLHLLEPPHQRELVQSLGGVG